MPDYTPQQIADQLNSLQARAVNIVQGTIAGAANPGGSIAFTYRNPIDGQTYTAQGTAWNQCSPSQVNALKMEDGSWVLVGVHEPATVREVVHTDRRARARKPPVGRGNTIMWLDSSWLVEGTMLRPELAPNNAKALLAFIDYLSGGGREIYTLANDIRIFHHSRQLSNPFLASALRSKGISVVEVSRIVDAKGLFFLPLLSPTYRLTPGEFKHLRSLARRPKSGLLITGEWSSWLDFDRHLLRGLNIRPGIGIAASGWVPTYQMQKSAVFSSPFSISGDSYGKFTGLNKDEILAIAEGTQEPVFALLKTN